MRINYSGFSFPEAQVREIIRILWSAGAISGNMLYPANALQAQSILANDLRRYEAQTYEGVYFDSTAADDTGSGKENSPYKVFSAARILAGKRSLIKCGSSFTGGAGEHLLIPTGTPLAPVIIDSYGTGAKPLFNGAASTRLFRGADGATDVRIRNLELMGADTGRANNLVLSMTPPADANTFKKVSTRWIVEGMTIHRNLGTGVANEDAVLLKLYGADNRVLNNICYNVGTDAMWLHGYNFLVQGNYCHTVATDGNVAGDCCQFGADSSFSIVQGNTFDHRSARGKQGLYFQQTLLDDIGVSNRVLVQDNIFYGYDVDVTDSHTPCYVGARNSICRRNIVYGGSQCIILGYNTVAYNNICVAPVGKGIVTSNYNLVFNNTIIQTGAQTGQTNSVGIRNGDATAVGNKAWNNVIIGFYNSILCVIGPDGQPNIQESNNAFTIPVSASATYYRVGGVGNQPLKNPVFTGFALDANYRPGAGSTLFNAGLKSVLDLYPENEKMDRDQVLIEGSNACIGAYLGAYVN